MTRYGEEFELTQDLLDAIGSYMDDEIRENVHAEMCPCTPTEFLYAYLDRDKAFEELLEAEFGIVLPDDMLERFNESQGLVYKETVLKTEMQEIREMSGLSRVTFSNKYNIPLKALENWEAGRKIPPAFVPGLLRKMVRKDAEAVKLKDVVRLMRRLSKEPVSVDVTYQGWREGISEYFIYDEPLSTETYEEESYMEKMFGVDRHTAKVRGVWVYEKGDVPGMPDYEGIHIEAEI